MDFGVMTDQQQRIYSLRAGMVASVVVAIADGVGLLFNHYFLGWELGGTWGFLLSLLGAGFSGFLFGVTYRYLINPQRDHHLEMGAVGAFALVKVLGLVESQGAALTMAQGVMWAVLLGEYLLGFSLARWLIHGAIARRWIRLPQL